jgi:hypothetical protein
MYHQARIIITNPATLSDLQEGEGWITVEYQHTGRSGSVWVEGSCEITISSAEKLGLPTCGGSVLFEQRLDADLLWGKIKREWRKDHSYPAGRNPEMVGYREDTPDKTPPTTEEVLADCAETDAIFQEVMGRSKS